jgi:hypothetical protein
MRLIVVPAQHPNDDALGTPARWMQSQRGCELAV